MVGDVAVASTAPITFGLDGDPDHLFKDSDAPADVDQKLPPKGNLGLGNGSGGHLARTALGTAGVAMVGQESPRCPRRARGSKLDHPRVPLDSTVPPATTPRNIMPLKDDEPKTLFMSLMLNDTGPVHEDDIVIVRDHRWSFTGSIEIARQGQGFCCFVRCLLDLQRNVQLEEDGDALEPKIVRACKLFVNCQIREGRAAEMYQLFTHFVCNTIVFNEWERYLTGAFSSPLANQETHLVPHLEQVWSRFRRLSGVLEKIFQTLDVRFISHHRLPAVKNLLLEHMKRRCFSTDLVTRNELIAQEKCGNETLKEIKRSFGLGIM
eukprot:gnl/TRDRNA2_/TRDRNA2_196494_c0_seq1.p1 gnl/TRDRNA2_/TRDRNA2_196494_c0~~gnl/TRDRNA2_/TRDRNA2_196494_c0_seq1.p1  ORF type:complete len:322 (+),score=34.51 gnl/TRDRNA2_/TRDRNA2_196494_c0_seq1:90-1055(+)